MAQRILLLNSIMMVCATVGSSQDFWEEIGSLNKGSVWSLAVGAEERIFALTDSGLYRSTNSGTSWMLLDVPSKGGYNSGLVAIGPYGDVFTADSSGVGIQHSTDHGDTWTFRAPNIGNPIRFATHPAGSYFFIGWSGTYRSTDNGVSWDSVSNIGGRTLEIDSEGTIHTVPNVSYRSTDQGESWISSGGPDISHDGVCQVYDLVVSATGKLIAATDEEGIYASADHGVTWTRLEIWGHIEVSSLAIDSYGQIFFCPGPGVLRSMDDAHSWSSINAGLTDSSALSLAINPTGFIYVGTSNGKVFRSTNPTTDVGEGLWSLPTGFTFDQNYPNPFNPTTTIRFSLPERAQVALKVYNLMGQEVATLVDERVDAGSKTVEFHGDGLPSGIYFCLIRTGTIAEMRKMVLLK